MKISTLPLTLGLVFLFVFSSACGISQKLGVFEGETSYEVRASLAEALNELASVETPKGVDYAAFQQLKKELARAMVVYAGHSVSAAPTGDLNRITDLAYNDQGGGVYRLEWSYRNLGDYDQNGEVGVPDITPIAQHYLHARNGLNVWQDSLDEVIDGDASGEVGISDITAIAQNYLVVVTGYAIETASNAAGPWTVLTTASMTSQTVESRKTFSEAVPLGVLDFVRVVPIGNGTERGDVSNIVTLTNQPPEIASVSPLTGASGAIVRFNANATGTLPFTYEWNFGGGATPNTSTDAEPLVTLGAGGTYNGSVTITNSLGNDSLDFSLNVTAAGDAPDITWIDPTYGLTGTNLTLVPVVSGQVPLTYAWDFGGGATPNISSEVSPTVLLGAAGEYNANLTVTNPFGADVYNFILNVAAEDIFPPVWDDTVGILTLNAVVNTNSLRLTFGRATDGVDPYPYYIVYWNKTSAWNISDLQNMYITDLWDVDPDGIFPAMHTIIGLEPGVEYTVLVRAADHAIPAPNEDINTNILTATVDANGLLVSEITPSVTDQPAGTLITFSATVSGGDGVYDAVWSDDAEDYGYFFELNVNNSDVTTRWGCAQGEVWPSIFVEVTDGSGHSGIQEFRSYYVANGTPLTFTNDVYPIVNDSCTGCHGSSGGLSMPNASTAYANLIGVNSSEQPSVKRVVAFDPANSYLIRKILNEPSITGQRMPPGVPLSQNDKDMFIRWIIGGALQ